MAIINQRNILKSSWQKVVSEITKMDTIFAEQLFKNTGAPRPKPPFITLKIINGPNKAGSFDSQIHIPSTQKFLMAGMRQYTISLNGYGEDTMDAFADLHTILDTSDFVTELTKLAGIAIVSYGNIIDVSALMETSFEPRFNMDIVFNTSVNVEFDPSIIEKAHLEGELEDDNGNVFETDQIIE